MILSNALVGLLALSGPNVEVTPADGVSRALGDLGVSAAHIQWLAVPPTAMAVDVPIEIGGTEHTLRLWPHDVRAADFRLIEADGASETVLPTPPSVTLRGAVLDEPDSRVAVSIVDGRLEGLIKLGDELYGVQPAFQLGTGVHAVYHTDQRLPVDATCGTVERPTSIQNFLDRTRLAVGTLGFVAELAIDADYEFYQLNGSSTIATQNDVTNVINAMDGIYGSQLDMDHVITTIIVRSTSNDPYGASNPSTLLTQFATHWGNQQTGVQRDSAHLFTGRNLNGSTIGIANGSSVCSGTGYALSQSRYTGNFSARVALTAHEIGHTMNAYHCNQSPPCRIMCSSLGGCGSISSFGPMAVSSIAGFRNSRTCFDVSSPPILSGISPAAIEVLEGDRVTLTGCHFSTLSSVTVGGVELSFADSRITVLDDNTMQVLPPTQAQFGALDIFVTGPGGQSATQTVQLVETSPPRLILQNDSFGNFPMTLDWGASPGDLYLIFYTLNDSQSFAYQGFDLLTNGTYSGAAGVCDAAGLGHFEVTIPAFSLIYQTLYTQVILLNGGFDGATPIESTYFQI